MKTLTLLMLLAAMVIHGNVLAVDAKQDGKWRGSGGAALSISSGNTRSSSLNLSADAARVTSEDKLSFKGHILGSRSEKSGVASTSANQWSIGTRYDHNISAVTFGFGGLDFSRDQIKLLTLRRVVSGGMGYHLLKGPETQWDILGGASHRADQYSGAGISINNQQRTSFNSVELLLGEESTHKFNDVTSFRQSLMVYPNLSNSKGARATLDAGLQVSMNKTFSLSVKLQNRYDSLAQAPIKKNDLMFFTGINVKFGE